VNLSGIDVAPQADGTVVITASAKGKNVKLRVTREYARRLAAQLVGVTEAPAEPQVPMDLMDRLVDAVTKRRSKP
jgi:hypothetical protein